METTSARDLASERFPVPGDLVASTHTSTTFELSDILADRPSATIFGGFNTGLGLRMPVAIKVLKTRDAKAFEILAASVQVASRFGGPHIVRIFDVGRLPSQHPYVVMDRLHGRSLDRLLASDGALPLPVAADIVIQLCGALDSPHAANVIHGDIKPTSLLLSARPDGDLRVSLLGLHRPSNCSPGYASPEQLGTRADIDARTDIWALGILLYEMITGNRAYPVDTLDAMRLRALVGPLPPMTSPHGRIPETLEHIVRRATMIHRTGRFNTVAELAKVLTPFAALPRPRTAAPRASADPTVVRGSVRAPEPKDSGDPKREARVEDQTVTRAALAAPALHAPDNAENPTTVRDPSDPYTSDAADSSRTIARRAPSKVTLRPSRRARQAAPARSAAPFPEAPASARGGPYSDSDPDDATRRTPTPPTRNPRDTMTSIPRGPRLSTPSASMAITSHAVAPVPVAPAAVAPTAVAPVPLAPASPDTPPPTPRLAPSPAETMTQVASPARRPSSQPAPAACIRRALPPPSPSSPSRADEVTRISVVLPRPPSVPSIDRLPSMAPIGPLTPVGPLASRGPRPPALAPSVTPLPFPPAPSSDAPAMIDVRPSHHAFATSRRPPKKPSSALRVFVPLGLVLGVLFGTLWVSRDRLLRASTRSGAAAPPSAASEVTGAPASALAPPRPLVPPPPSAAVATPPSVAVSATAPSASVSAAPPPRRGGRHSRRD